MDNLIRSWRTAFFAGIRAELPILVGVIPFGLIYGVLALQSGLPRSIAFAMSSVVFAGSAQVVAAQLFTAGAPGALILLTTAILNLRHLLYSASVAPYLKPLRPMWKWVLAYFLTDEVYAVAIMRLTQAGLVTKAFVQWFFLGAGLTLWVAWQISTAVGILLGTQVPAQWSLDFALPLTFIALVVPALTDRPTMASALIGGLVAVAADPIPLRLGLMLGTLAGIFVGLTVERTSLRSHRLDPSTRGD